MSVRLKMPLIPGRGQERELRCCSLDRKIQAFGQEIQERTDFLPPILEQVKHNCTQSLFQKNEELHKHLIEMSDSIQKLKYFEQIKINETDEDILLLKKQIATLSGYHEYFKNYLCKLESRAMSEITKIDQLIEIKSGLVEQVKVQKRAKNYQLVKYFR